MQEGFRDADESQAEIKIGDLRKFYLWYSEQEYRDGHGLSCPRQGRQESLNKK